LIADEILHSAARNHSLDNLSIVFIAFQKFKDYIEQGRDEPKPLHHYEAKEHDNHCSTGHVHHHVHEKK
jgi:hypothetical protein